jgi:hypothetical protein
MLIAQTVQPSMPLPPPTSAIANIPSPLIDATLGAALLFLVQRGLPWIGRLITTEKQVDVQREVKNQEVLLQGSIENQKTLLGGFNAMLATTMQSNSQLKEEMGELVDRVTTAIEKIADTNHATDTRLGVIERRLEEIQLQLHQQDDFSELATREINSSLTKIEAAIAAAASVSHQRGSIFGRNSAKPK